MAVRFSNRPIAYRTLRGFDCDAFVADLHLALTAVGWTVNRTVTGGYVYLLTSPEFLSCKCRVQNTGGLDFGGYPYVEIQFMSADELRLGIVHQIVCDAILERASYQIICGLCQMFISLPHRFTGLLPDLLYGYFVCGGVPAMPQRSGPTCYNASAPSHSESWWSVGTNPVGAEHFRGGRHAYRDYTVCINGALTAQDTRQSYEDYPLQLLALTPTNNVDFWAFNPPRTVKFDGTPMHLDAMIGYGRGMFGQIWDAWTMSRDMPGEDIQTSWEDGPDGTTYLAHWLAYNYGLAGDLKGGQGTYYATLYLLKDTTPDLGAPGGDTESNYVY